MGVSPVESIPVKEEEEEQIGARKSHSKSIGAAHPTENPVVVISQRSNAVAL
jgi:hypothetical protein